MTSDTTEKTRANRCQSLAGAATLLLGVGALVAVAYKLTSASPRPAEQRSSPPGQYSCVLRYENAAGQPEPDLFVYCAGDVRYFRQVDGRDIEVLVSGKER